jgi:hypothetical protein
MGDRPPSCPNCRGPLVPVAYEPGPEEMGDSDADPGALDREQDLPTHYCQSCQRAVRMGEGSVERN